MLFHTQFIRNFIYVKNIRKLKKNIKIIISSKFDTESFPGLKIKLYKLKKMFKIICYTCIYLFILSLIKLLK